MKKKSEKKFFFMGDCHTIHYTMGNSHHKKNFSPWETPTFFSPPLWEIPTTFFINSPMGNPQKKSGKKFFFGIYGQLFPQKWGCPLGRGGMGGYLPPPMGYMGGGDCLSRLLIKITCSGTCSGATCSVCF
jgi:hypothetical protein